MKKRASKRLSRQDETIRAVTAWQASDVVHPLTCGNDSSHRPLEAVKDGRRAILRCLDCDYIQRNIPAVVLTAGPKLPKRRPSRSSVVVPPIGVSFEEAVKRLLKAKPPAKTAPKAR